VKYEDFKKRIQKQFGDSVDVKSNSSNIVVLGDNDKVLFENIGFDVTESTFIEAVKTIENSQLLLG
jgi:hypothetical protein